MSRKQRLSLRRILRAAGLRVRSRAKWERTNRQQQSLANVIPPTQQIARTLQYWQERL
jgi:hypothetical protein